MRLKLMLNYNESEPIGSRFMKRWAVRMVDHCVLVELHKGQSINDLKGTYWTDYKKNASLKISHLLPIFQIGQMQFQPLLAHVMPHFRDPQTNLPKLY